MNIHKFLRLDRESERASPEAMKARKEELLKRKADLGREVRSKERLVEDLRKEKEDSTATEKRLSELKDQSTLLDRELSDLESLQEQEAKETHQWLRRHYMTETLARGYGCSEGVEVDTLNTCFEALKVDLKKVDPAGRPLECRVQIDRNCSQSLRIVHAARLYKKEHCPPELSWLPIAQGKTSRPIVEEDAPDIRVFLVRESGDFILSRTVLRGEDGMKRAVEEEYADAALSIDETVRKCFAQEQGVLDLDKDYGTQGLMAHIRNEVLAQTTSTPPFEECGEALGSQEVYQKIKAPWDSFLKCPWAANVRGTLALLKHLAEGGERVHFWSGPFQGLYGFRVRTRDHDWVLGEVYLPPQSGTATGRGLIIHGKEFAGDWVASLDGMFLRVEDSASQK